MKSPSPEDPQQSPTSSVHLDHKTSLFVLSDSNTDSNEQKPKNSETSSESDYSFNDEDSQESDKKPPTKGKAKKEKEVDKSASKVPTMEKNIFVQESSPVEEAKPDIVKPEESKPLTPKSGKVGNLKKGTLLTEKALKATSEKPPGKAQEVKLPKSIPVLSEAKKKEDSSIESDVYEFKEPEPFEFEAAASTSRKPITASPQQSSGQSQASLISSPATQTSEDKKPKKGNRLSDVEVKPPATPPTKKQKKSPGKPEPVVVEKAKVPVVVKKEEISPKSTPIISLENKPADLFDVLRKSPSFNISNPPITGQTSDKLPEFTQTISSDSFSTIVDVKTTISMASAGSSMTTSIISKVASTLGGNNIQKVPVISSAFVNTKNDDDQWQSLKMFKNAVEGQDDMDIDETITKKLKPLKELDRKSDSTFDLKSEVKSSIADKLLKTLNQPVEKLQIPIPKINQNKEFAEKLEQQAQNLPKIMKKDALNLDLPSITKVDPGIESSPDHKLEILDLNPPKNNDLSETIQKLKSAIKENEDSSDSTDSEQRLVIEDESQSSEGNVVEKPTSEKEDHSPWPDDEKEDLSLKKEKLEIRQSLPGTASISSVTLKEKSLSFASKFQESFSAHATATAVISKVTKPELKATEGMPGIKMDLTCNESLDDPFVMDKKEGVVPGSVAGSTVETTVTEEKFAESISLLLCEETIPGSPVATHGLDGSRKLGAIDSKSLEERKLEMKGDGSKDPSLRPQTPTSSLRDSQSPDDSKSDSEDLKKQGEEF